MTSLSSQQALNIVSDLISDDMNDDDRKALFLELVSQPITSDVLSGGVAALKKHMIVTNIDTTDAVDTCGTGGSGKKTVNTSTLNAFIVSAAGGKVAKHGNRSASGNCGCFDLLEHLGVNIDLTPEMEQQVFNELGIVFLFAPLHHPSLRHVGPLRKEYGKKTVFNLMGPLCNPAGITTQLIGAGTNEHAEIIANALRDSGVKRAMVATGYDGLDEVTVTDKTTIRSIENSAIYETIFQPEDHNIQLSSPKRIEGGTADVNLEIFVEIAKGNGSTDIQNLAIVNAAHVLLLTSLVSDIGEALTLARETLRSGAVFETFEKYKEYSHSL